MGLLCIRSVTPREGTCVTRWAGALPFRRIIPAFAQSLDLQPGPRVGRHPGKNQTPQIMSQQPWMERSVKKGRGSPSQDGFTVVSTSSANIVIQEADTGCSSQSRRRSRGLDCSQLSRDDLSPPRKTEGRERFPIVCQSHMLASALTYSQLSLSTSGHFRC